MKRPTSSLLLLLATLGCAFFWVACSSGVQSPLPESLAVALADCDRVVTMDSHSVIAVKKGKMGVLSTDGTVIVPFHYDTIGAFHCGLAGVRRDNLYGFVDTKGQVVVECQYDSVGEYSEGLAFVIKDGLYGYVNQQGILSIPIKYALARPFSEGVAVVADGTTYDFGCVNAHDSVIIPLTHEGIGSFSEGLAAVEYAGLWGYMDHHGRLLIPYQFDAAYEFADSMARVRTSTNGKGQYGFINHSGETTVDFVYDDAMDFHEQLAAVCNGDGWGFVNSQGLHIVPCGFQEARPYHNGFGQLLKDGKWLTFGKDGHEVKVHLKGPRHTLVDNYGSFCTIRKRNLYGISDTLGNIIVPCKFKHPVTLDR